MFISGSKTECWSLPKLACVVLCCVVVVNKMRRGGGLSRNPSIYPQMSRLFSSILYCVECCYLYFPHLVTDGNVCCGFVVFDE